MKVRLDGEQDISRNFIMKLPKGQPTLTIMLQPIYKEGNEKNRPFLYYSHVEKLGEEKDKIDFPPSTADRNFLIARQYSGKGYLSVVKRIKV